MAAGIDRQLELGADPVIRRDQQGIRVACCLRVQEAADLAQDRRPRQAAR